LFILLQYAIEKLIDSVVQRSTINSSVNPSVALETQNRSNSTRLNQFCVRNVAPWGRQKTATYQWFLTTHQTEGLFSEAFCFSVTCTASAE